MSCGYVYTIHAWVSVFFYLTQSFQTSRPRPLPRIATDGSSFQRLLPFCWTLITKPCYCFELLSVKWNNFFSHRKKLHDFTCDYSPLGQYCSRYIKYISWKFILRARLLRKVLGGGMRQVGVVAAAGIYALDNMVERLKDDHIQTYNIAKGNISENILYLRYK